MRVLLTWELGGNLGHLSPLAGAARALIDRGHEVWLSVPDLTAVHQVVDQDVVRVVHGPTLPHHPIAAPPRTWADVVRPNVFRDPRLLANGLRAWRALVRAIAPDVLVFDSSPMAMLATRDLPLRRVVFDLGWSVPPPTTPLPPIQEGLTLADREAADAEAMAVIRAGCALAGIDAPDRLGALFDADATLIHAFAELEHYPQFPGRRHVGPAFTTDAGDPPRWPVGDGPKVFVYLKAEHPNTQPLLRLLPQLGARTVAYVPGLDPAAATALAGPRLHLSPRPLRIRDVLADCALAACHSMAGTGAAFVVAGVPVLAMPMYVEQILNARQAASHGLATFVPFGVRDDALRSLVERALSARSAAMVRRYARRLRGFDPQAPYVALCDAVEGAPRADSAR